MAKTKEVKCYYCGYLIETSNQLVEKKIPMATKAGIRNYRRQFHMDCLPKYVQGLEDKELKSAENTDWDQVYKYFRKEILGMNETLPLPEHATKRLLGLRLGQYYPQGNNTRILPRGYDFRTILLAMKVVNPRVQAYLRTANFSNMKHRVDGIMKFISGEIPDVAKRIATQKEANEKLDNDVIKTPTFDYKSRLKKKKEEENGNIADDIASLLGGSL
ncbi:hypothetical protein ACP8H2_09605 [Bacillus subtilis]|uniref:hypothetical protein n=1 Tax=Bacillus subtilis TaxID=1423 RepID=UPI003CF13085